MERKKFPWFYWSFWSIALAGAIWLYFYPVDNFVPRERSERRPVPVAHAEEKDKATIEERVAFLLDEYPKIWNEKFGQREGRVKPFGEPPATTKMIARLERQVGPLPVAFKAYLMLHNGGGRLFESTPLLNCNHMLSQSIDLLAIGTDYQQLPLTHEDIWFHPGALVFEEADGGGLVINATNGVIYSWNHDGGPFLKVGNGFLEMLETTNQKIKDGQLPDF